MKYLHVKDTVEYMEIRKVFEEQRELLTQEICNEFLTYGVDLRKEFNESVDKKPGYRLNIIIKHYGEVAGKYPVIDDLCQKRFQVEPTYELQYNALCGVKDFRKAPKELKERCFLKDIEIEERIKQIDFTKL